MHNKNIVAIGGGGFGRSLGSLDIEKYIISLVSIKRPKICFIPTASGDSSLYKLLSPDAVGIKQIFGLFLLIKEIIYFSISREPKERPNPPPPIAIIFLLLW